MSTIEQESQFADWPTMDGDKLHRYPRLYGDPRPRVGDRAMCGHIKQRPDPFPGNVAAGLSGLPHCAECLRLAEIYGTELR